MAKKKRGRRRASLLTKAINIGVLALAFSRPIKLILEGNTDALVDEATVGMRRGTFNKDFAMKFYGPMLAAIVLKKAISMVRKTARV